MCTWHCMFGCVYLSLYVWLCVLGTVCLVVSLFQAWHCMFGCMFVSCTVCLVVCLLQGLGTVCLVVCLLQGLPVAGHRHGTSDGHVISLPTDQEHEEPHKSARDVSVSLVFHSTYNLKHYPFSS